MSTGEVVLDTLNYSVADLSDDELSVIRFWAPWCVSCRAMEVHVNDLLAHHGTGFKAYSINIDRNRELAEVLEVKYLPELMILKSGEEVGRIVGEVAYDELENTLLEYY